MKRRKCIIAVSVSCVVLAALATVSLIEIAPRIVWNATPSAPVGFYRIEHRVPVIRDWVLVTPRKSVREFIDDRGYLPSEMPLIKRLAAQKSDQICRQNEQIFINKTHVADALITDSRVREMPQWSGCITLKDGQYFLLNAHPKSLDGRYFGVTGRDEIIGVAVPVWVRKGDDEELSDSDNEVSKKEPSIKILFYGKIKGTAPSAVQSQSAHQKKSATVNQVGANERHHHDRR